MSIFTSNIELSSDNYPTIRPTLDLNFAATKTLDRRITFTRDSAGTYVDEMGIIRYATNNVPRFDHDPTTGESLGLLIEESRTNSLTYSNSIGGTGWTNGRTTTLLNNTTSPDGSTTASKIVGASPDQVGNKRVFQTVTLLDSTEYTYSLYAKASELSGVRVLIGTNVEGVYSNGNAKFDLSNGTVNSGTGTITDVGNGWYRISATMNTSSDQRAYRLFANTGNFNAGGSESFYYWGPQVESGNFETSYIPTYVSNVSVTRAQDIPLITGTNFTDFYNQNEGTLVLSADIGYLATSNQAAVVFEDTSSQSTDLIALGYRVGGGASGGLGGWYQGNGAQVIYQHHSVGVTANSEFRQALAYKTDDLASVANGTTPLTDNSGTLSTSIDRVRFGEYYADGKTSGHIRQFKYYNKRLPDAQLQGLTQQ